MRLALAVGRLDVQRVLAELTSADIALWQAFERVEGSFGERGHWERTAMLASMYANAHRDVQKRPQPFRPDEFVPFVEQPRRTGKTLRAQLGHLVKKPKGK